MVYHGMALLSRREVGRLSTDDHLKFPVWMSAASRYKLQLVALMQRLLVRIGQGDDGVRSKQFHGARA